MEFYFSIFPLFPANFITNKKENPFAKNTKFIIPLTKEDNNQICINEKLQGGEEKQSTKSGSKAKVHADV